MVTPRDWIPPFPPGDERNTRHRAYYDRFLRIFPAAPASEAQHYANVMLRKDEQGFRK